MKLDVGSMDNVQTTPDLLPALKKVLFKVIAPSDPDSVRVEFKEGRIKAIAFTLQVDEPTPYVVEVMSAQGPTNVKRDACGRVLSIKANWYVDKDEFLGWKGSTQVGYDNKDYLRTLKQFGDAIGVDFARQDVEDAYGRTLRADIVQRRYETTDGEERTANEVKNFRKSDAK